MAKKHDLAEKKIPVTCYCEAEFGSRLQSPPKKLES
jgi:hypothetical protein